MSGETLWRATFEVGEAVGRRLSGLALPWDKPTLVRDVRGGPFPGKSYKEAFSPGSGDVSMRMHPGGFPSFTRHDYSEDPIGTVIYSRSGEGLMFDLTLSRTRAADDKLTLVNDGSLRSVSVGFRPMQAAKRGDLDLYRTEIALRELSLAPTGMGQYEDALVTAVRTEELTELAAAMGTPVLDAMKRRRARIHL